MNLTKKISFTLLVIFYASSTQATDIVNAKIDIIIHNLNATIVTVSSSSHPQVNTCLSTDPAHREQVNKMYSFILSNYVAGNNLGRISFDPTQNVPGCGFPIIEEVR